MSYEQNMIQKMTQYTIPQYGIQTTTCNNCGISSYAPYIFDPTDEKVLIDTEWWNNLTQYTKELLNKRLGDHLKYGKVTIPHKHLRKNDMYDIIYNTINDAYDYNVWYEENKICPSDVKMIKLSNEDKLFMLRISK